MPACLNRVLSDSIKVTKIDLTSTEYNGVITCLLHAAERINFLSPLPPASSYRPIPRTLGATNLISFLSEGKIGQETKRGRET